MKKYPAKRVRIQRKIFTFSLSGVRTFFLIFLIIAAVFVPMKLSFTPHTLKLNELMPTQFLILLQMKIRLFLKKMLLFMLVRLSLMEIQPPLSCLGYE
jgi:hypothetical protein